MSQSHLPDGLIDVFDGLSSPIEKLATVADLVSNVTRQEPIENGPGLYYLLDGIVDEFRELYAALDEIMSTGRETDNPKAAKQASRE